MHAAAATATVFSSISNAAKSILADGDGTG